MKIQIRDKIRSVKYSQLVGGEAFVKDVQIQANPATIYFKIVGLEIQWIDGHWMRQGVMSNPDDLVTPIEMSEEIIVDVCLSHRDEDHEIR